MRCSTSLALTMKRLCTPNGLGTPAVVAHVPLGWLLSTLLTLTLLCSTAVLPVANGIKAPWIALASQGISFAMHNTNKGYCETVPGLNKRQKMMCRQHYEMMDAVKYGALLAIEECQWQFRDRRWNCSQVHSKTIFGPLLDLGTRETAFIYAATSAGVAWTVTKSCSGGTLPNCGCDQTYQNTKGKGFKWAGCSDHISFGIMFSTKFIDAREHHGRRPLTERSMMNLHNNMVGRKTIEDNMNVLCKCHGVSGSCAERSCWRSMPSFRLIGDKIKEKFDRAIQTKMRSRTGGRITLEPVEPVHSTRRRNSPPQLDVEAAPGGGASFGGASTSPTGLDANGLVYLQPSPDFCDHDVRLGSLGTRGRLCNHTLPDTEYGSCASLCCQRGYTSQKVLVTERCRCGFIWCCKVKCKECTRHGEEYRCN